MRTTLFLLLTFFLLIHGLVLPVDVVTVDGKSVSGRAINVAKGVLKIGEETFPLEEVIICRWEREKKQAFRKDEFIFGLHNGDRIAGAITSGDEQMLTILSRSWGSLTLDMRVIENITIKKSPQKKQSSAREKGRVQKDTILFMNGDSLTGMVKTITPQGLAFESIVGTRHYAFSELSSIVLNTPRAKVPSPGETYRS